MRTSICGSKRTSTLFLNEYLDSVQMVEILNTEEDGAQLNRGVYFSQKLRAFVQIVIRLYCGYAYILLCV